MNDNLRRVTVEACPTYQSDSGAGKYVFKVKRYYYSTDLSTLNAYLKIKFQDESTDKILLSEKVSDNDDLTITFVVSDAVTRVAGRAECQLCFENSDGSITVNTEIFTVTILDSVEIESYGQTILPSAIRLLQTKLHEMIEDVNEKTEALKKAFVVKNVAVSGANFNNGTQSLTIEDVKEDSFVSFTAIGNVTACTNAGVYISSWEDGFVTLGCQTKPVGTFTLRFLIVTVPDKITVEQN